MQGVGKEAPHLHRHVCDQTWLVPMRSRLSSPPGRACLREEAQAPDRRGRSPQTAAHRHPAALEGRGILA